MADPATKDELIALIRSERARLDALANQVKARQLTHQMLADGYTVKDILAHVTWWEQRMLELIETARRGEPVVGLAAPGEDAQAAVDRVNAQVFDAQRNVPLDEVEARARRSYAQVLETIGDLEDDEVFAETGLRRQFGGSALKLIAEDTYEHYREHVEQLQSLLAGGARA